MRKDVKELWISALRSGNYKQGKGALNRRGNFCCLGVLCEAILDNKEVVNLEEDFYKVIEVKGVSLDKAHYHYGGFSSISLLYAPILNELRIDSEAMHTLINMNDVYDKSFSEIADWIEATL